MAPSVQQLPNGASASKKANVAHPLCPLTGDEIKAASSLVQSVWPSDAHLRFKVVMLEEPPKADLMPYLDAEHSEQPLPHVDRKAFVAYYIRNTVS
jgi:primary-amine oxidase